MNGQSIVPKLVKKLADSNIQIRQLVMRSFLLMKGMKQTNYLNMILPYLSSPSWHIREEVLHLIMVSFLKNTNDFDYMTVLDQIAKLLDDPKSTVRFTCRETIATLVFKGNKNRVTEVLYELVEPKEYNRLCDRFDQGSCPKFYEDSLIFEFPALSNGSRRNMSSRGSNFSDGSRRNMSNEKPKRSRIGDSPLTYKGFEYQKGRDGGDTSGLTVADNYKHGPTPSERMKKFNGSQPPLVKNIGGSMHSSEYNNFSMPINTTQDIEKPKDMTQNLRLLKDKIRVGSAGSDDSEPYSNIKVGNNSRGYANRNLNLKIKNSENRVMNSFEDHNSDNVPKFCNSYRK